jgi:hypothetical protein
VKKLVAALALATALVSTTAMTTAAQAAAPHRTPASAGTSVQPHDCINATAHGVPCGGGGGGGALLTCDTYTMDGPGKREVTPTGGQVIYINVYNNSSAGVNFGADENPGANYLWSGYLGPYEGTTIKATMFGNEPMVYDLDFSVDGPNINEISIAVQSSVC